MAGKGGYQAPSSPAPVSGPGRLSRRTDGGPSQPIRQIPGGSYGDRKELTQLQQGAPLAQVPSLPTASQGGGGAVSASPVTPIPLSAPTQRPDEPVTAGAALGPGPGPEALGVAGMGPAGAYVTGVDALRQLAPVAATNPEVAFLLQRLEAHGL